MKNINKYLIYVLLLLFSLIPIVLIIKYQPYSDYFVAYRAAELNRILSNKYLNLNTILFKYDIGFQIIIRFILSRILDVSPSMLRYFPFGLILLGPTLFVLIKKISKNLIITFFSTLSLFFSTLFGLNLFTIGPQAWSYTIHLIILYIIFMFLKNSFQSNSHLFKYKIILFVLIFSINFYYYTPTMWTISALFVLFMFDILYHYKNKIFLTKLRIYSFLFSVILFFSTSNILYNAYLPGVVSNRKISLLQIFRTFFLGFPKTPYDSSFDKYLLSSSSQNFFNYFLHLIIYIIPIILILWFLIIITKNNKNMLSGKNSKYFLFGFIILGIGFSDTFLNYLNGEIILEYLLQITPLLFFPLLFNILKKKNKKKVIVLCMIFFSINIMSFCVSVYNETYFDPSDNNPALSTKFLLQNQNKSSRILASLEMHGILEIDSSEINNSFKNVYYNLSKYEKVIFGNSSINSDYILIDKVWNRTGLSPFNKTGWLSFKSLYNFKNQIDFNRNSNLIFTNDLISIYFKR